jgi:exopolysaccharide production protein ExoZ
MILTACSPGAVFHGGTFLLRRLIRIGPIYWALTLVFAFAYLSLPDLFRVNRAMDVPHILRSLAFIPDGVAPPFYQGWTLSFEMAFYLLIAAVRSPSPQVTARRVALAVFAGVSIHLLWAPRGPIAALLTSPMMLEFCYGAAIGALYLGGRLHSRSVAVFAGVATIAIGSLMFTDMVTTADALKTANGADPAFVRALLQGLPSALLVLTLVSAEACGVRFPVCGMILCDASYSIYLIQVLTEPMVNKAMLRLGTPWPIATALVSISFTVLAGIMFYLIFERPITRRLNRRPQAERRVLPVPSAL